MTGRNPYETASRDSSSNILCACPAIGPSKRRQCQEFLQQVGATGTIIGVTIATAPGNLIADVSEVIDSRSTTLSFVDISHGGRSAATTADGFGGQNGALVDVVEIDDVDLHRIGTAIGTLLEDTSQAPVVLCFDSLTDILQTESQESVHRFLNALTARVEEHGVYAFYHIDSEGHSERTFETLAPIFDATVSVDSGLE